MLLSKDLDFFLELKANNHREWFADNKYRYDEIVSRTQSLAERWIVALGRFDESILSNDPKKSIFRIYRDVRFSKNKTPYKTHIGLAIGKEGRSSKWAGWYLHIEPGASFLAAGKWAPDNDELKAIRQEIDYNLEEFFKIIQNEQVKINFGGLDTEHSLKNAPKDYPYDHPAIKILKLKSFLFAKNYTDKEVLSEGFISQLIADSELLIPFVKFLNRALEDTV
ncbi:MAG: DUF2461 domain-containing protein [Chitinophagales bacterium]|nr:DUF2461 domain-containing protein [Chitinophagales bacterium]MCZ2393744.1 DUF2461 domain-containing protein [Chitinophagales bacterium]